MTNPTTITASIDRDTLTDETLSWADEATRVWMTAAADDYGVEFEDETYEGLDNEHDAAGVQIDGDWYRIVVGKSGDETTVELREWAD